MTTTPPETAQELRWRAEEKSLLDEVTPLQLPSPEETQLLLHDLRVHQIELEMQVSCGKYSSGWWRTNFQKDNLYEEIRC